MKFDGVICHDELRKNITPYLSYDENTDFNDYKEKIREKLIELLGIERIKENSCPLKIDIVEKKQKDGYEQIRFEFESEKNCYVPCYLLIPDCKKKKYPVAIVLQGHNESGFHSSIGNVLREERRDYDAGRGMFAVQAVKAGFVALAVEMRGRGERTAITTFDRRVNIHPLPGECYYEAMTAIMLGRTLIGERVYDISRAIDALEFFPECDMDNIVITGNSGGGTASFYTACYDERIKLCAPSCAFCTYDESIMKYYHCSCNYLPQAYLWFDMPDLTCLISPRKLAIVAGEYDTGFKIEGVLKGYETVKKVFKNAGVEENCSLTVNKAGHLWVEEVMWNIIRREIGC